MRPLVLLLSVLIPAGAAAQPTAAAAAGIVRDVQGAPIPGARVTARHTARGLVHSTLTNAQGLFEAAGLPPGTYRLTIEASGFTPVVHEDVALYPGDTSRLDTVLFVAGISESVQVVESSPVLRSETASLGHVVANPAIVSLPLNGRNFIALASLAPGVALPPGSTLPRINGGRPRTNEYLFDGISVLQPEPGQVAFFPVLDAIHSFTVETNAPAAEYGRFNGGVVNLATKSGTNVLSGTLFGFLRHERLNARNYFASTASTARDTPRFRRHQFGGVAGGPLLRDRTFIFVDYQGHRQSIGRTVISTVPTALQREGIFTEAINGRLPDIYDPGSGAPFANRTIPRERFDPVAATLLNRYPQPTGEGTANNYRRVDEEANDQNQWDIRVDQHVRRGADRAFARISSFADRFVPVTPMPDGSGAVSGTPGRQHTRARSAAANYSFVMPASLVNELRAGETSRKVTRRALGDGPLLPTYAIAGYQHLGPPANTHTDFSTGVRQVVNTLTWARGRHTVKSGIDFRWSRLDVVQPPSPAGSYQFTTLFTDLPGVPNTGSSLASFLLGQVQSFSIDVQEEAIRPRARTQEYFVQDTWRATERITVNGGLRYTLNFPSVEADDRAAVFNLDTRRLEYLGRDGHPRSARRLHTNNFGPRFGIAGHASDVDVVRAGYALIWIEQAGITTPFTTPSFPFLQTVSQRTLDNVTPAFLLKDGPGALTSAAPTADAGLGQGVFAVDRNLGSGYAQQWNISLQRQLSRRLSLEVAYVGSKITRVGIPDTNLNQLRVEQLAAGDALLRRVANPFYGTIPGSSTLGDPTITVAQLMKPFPQYTTVSLYRNNVGNTHYHGVTAKIEQRFGTGLTFSAAYTRSKLLDDASSVFDASVLTGPVANYPVADTFDRSRERDVSTGDMPHVFVASAAGEVPRTAGVVVSAVVTLQSGVPLPVTQVTNFNAFAGFGTQRPNRTGNPTLPAAERSPQRWFDTGAFSIAPQFTLGNSSRNAVRGPAYRNVDLAMAKRTRWSSHGVLETRLEVFNLLNTPALGAPNTVLGSPGFGSITTAGDPRVMQVAVKLHF